MNFSQMQESLRTILLRRIHRGDVTVTLLSRQSGLGKSHLSNFLHARGQLSMQALDRIMAAQQLTAEDLFEPGQHGQARFDRAQAVPLVSHTSALFEPDIRASSVQMWLHFPWEELQSLRHRRVASRRSWRRFVAIRMNRDDACAMDPLLNERAIAVIDRHYNSLVAFNPERQNVYAVCKGVRVMLRYIDRTDTHLIARPRRITSPASLIEIAEEVDPGEYIVGRVAFILNQV